MVHAGWLVDVMDVVDLLCWGEGGEKPGGGQGGEVQSVVVTGLHVVGVLCGIVKRSG